MDTSSDDDDAEENEGGGGDDNQGSPSTDHAQRDEGDPSGDDDAEEDGAEEQAEDVTLGDAKQANVMLYEYVLQPGVKELLPSGVDMDTVIGTKRVVNAGEADAFEIIDIPLATTGTGYICPFARVPACDQHPQHLEYTVNNNDGVCVLKQKCGFGGPEHCPCRRPGELDITLKMVENFVIVTYEPTVGFNGGQGPTYILRNDDGGVSLYSDSKRREMIAKMQSTILSGTELNFSPFMSNGRDKVRDIPFEMAFTTLAQSAGRTQYTDIVFAPDIEGCPGKYKPTSKQFNLFQGFAISKEAGIQSCLAAGIIPGQYSQFDGQVLYEFYEKAGVLTGYEGDHGRGEKVTEFLRGEGIVNDDDDEDETHRAVMQYLLRENVLEQQHLGIADDVTAEQLNAWAAAACDPLLDHVLQIISRGNKTDADYLLDWMAHARQKPWEKPCVMITLVSKDEGAGKNIVTVKFQETLGTKGAHELSIATADVSKITQRFNGALSNKILVVLNETDCSAADAAGKLKSLITDPEVTLENKFIDPMSQASFHRLLQTTNVQTGATPAAANSRRYKTYEVSNEKAGAQTAETKAYFDAIAAVPAYAFALFLDTRDISAYNPKQVHAGAADLAQVRANWTPVLRFIDGMLQQGHVLTDGSVAVRVWLFGGAPVPKKLIEAAFEAGNGKTPHFWTHFWGALGLKGANVAKEVKKGKDYGGVIGTRVPSVDFESLLAIRKAWSDTYYGDDMPGGWDHDNGARSRGAEPAKI